MKKNYKSLINKIQGVLSPAEKFHNNTKNKKLEKILSSDSMPSSWSKIHFKTYPRFKSYKNIVDSKSDNNLINAINNRASVRDFAGKDISFEYFFNIMKNSAGINRVSKSLDNSRRAYPSAGARYPLELYAIVLKVEDLTNGLYHYNVKYNTAELLLEKELNSEVVEIFGGERELVNASVIFLITGVLGRTMVKYGDRGYNYMLIEAGHLAQNICLLATDVNLGICTYGGFVEDKIIDLLDISIQKELPLYALAVGLKKRS